MFLFDKDSKKINTTKLIHKKTKPVKSKKTNKRFDVLLHFIYRVK